MNLSRRSVAKYLGLAPFAAPLAAKMASDERIANLAGVGECLASAAPSPSIGANVNDDTITKASEYIKLFGLPDFIKEETRRNSQYVGSLDPDIAAKRAWSMSVKILTQRERNLERCLERIKNDQHRYAAMDTFKKLAGIQYWPW